MKEGEEAGYWGGGEGQEVGGGGGGGDVRSVNLFFLF